MTKKDFQVISFAFGMSRPRESWLNKYIQWNEDVVTMAHELARTNERFDFGKFYSACGVVCGQKKGEKP